MDKSHLKLVAPATVNRTVTPKRPLNKHLRTREYLTEAEVGRLMEAAKDNRHGPGTRRWSLSPTDMGYERRKQLTYAEPDRVLHRDSARS